MITVVIIFADQLFPRGSIPREPRTNYVHLSGINASTRHQLFDQRFILLLYRLLFIVAGADDVCIVFAKTFLKYLIAQHFHVFCWTLHLSAGHVQRVGEEWNYVISSCPVVFRKILFY